jgi:hypothetical protein
MRESVGLACNSTDLEWCEFSVHDVDRLTALAYAGKVSPLGAEMYRLLVAGDQQSFVRATNIVADRMLARNIKDGMPFSWRLQIARQAVGEIVRPHCRVCNGAREIIESERGLRIVCTGCGGFGTHKYKDEERAKGIGVDLIGYTDKLRRLFDKALGIVTGEIIATNKELAKVLQE